jgi:hypothetical protein
VKIRKDGKTYFILLLSVMIGNGQIYEKCGNIKEAVPLGGMDGPNKKISICLSLKKFFR